MVEGSCGSTTIEKGEREEVEESAVCAVHDGNSTFNCRSYESRLNLCEVSCF